METQCLLEQDRHNSTAPCRQLSMHSKSVTQAFVLEACNICNMSSCSLCAMSLSETWRQVQALPESHQARLDMELCL